MSGGKPSLVLARLSAFPTTRSSSPISQSPAPIAQSHPNNPTQSPSSITQLGGGRPWMRGHAMWERGEGCPGRRGQSMETGGDCAQPTTKVVEHIRRGGECARGLATHAKCCSKASLAASKFKSSNGRDSKKTVCVVSRREAQEKRERRFRVGSCQTWVQSLDVGHMWRWTTSPFFPFPLPPAAQGKRWGGGGEGARRPWRPNRPNLSPQHGGSLAEWGPSPTCALATPTICDD